MVKIPIWGNKSKHTDHTVANRLTFVIAPDKGDNHCLFLSALEPIHRLDLQTWVLGCQALSQQLHLHHTSQATATWSAHIITSHHRQQPHGQLTPSHHITGYSHMVSSRHHITSQATATWSAHTITSHHRLQQHGQLTPSHHSLQPLSAQAISSH